ncbi:hypothetical protein C2845_PM05G17540 [Panicum miliaceum]|uniref:Uncharacterized protein n=1 Tax=Panicum miliaceum TaxID=4540 RepID=A0A3L6STD2_PANMI|nr:hypothetical protein C2845_PM05G17540 [Panicum miliaceum]
MPQACLCALPSRAAQGAPAARAPLPRLVHNELRRPPSAPPSRATQRAPAAAVCPSLACHIASSGGPPFAPPSRAVQRASAAAHPPLPSVAPRELRRPPVCSSLTSCAGSAGGPCAPPSCAAQGEPRPSPGKAARRKRAPPRRRNWHAGENNAAGANSSFHVTLPLNSMK